MVAYQPPDEPRVEPADPVPLAEGGGVALAVLGMVRAAPLGDVVKEPGKMKQLRLRQGGEDVRAVRKLLAMIGPPEAAQIGDGAQEVFVHSIGVEEVELHEAGDPAELGQVAAENSVGVHAPEGAGEPVRFAQDLEKEAPAREVAAKLLVHQVQVAADVPDRRCPDAAQLGMLLEEQEDLEQCEGMAPERVSIHHLDLPVADLEPPIEAPRGRSALTVEKAFPEKLEQQLVQPARVLDGPVVALHELLDAEIVVGVAIPEMRRDRDLEVE